jgi:poly-beta-1,6-N-acetyl-D-glucosamine synthase
MMQLLGNFIFFYPLYMSIIWIVGGLLFSLRRERKPPVPPEQTPFFSIVVPAHNETSVIAETILNLQDLDYPAYEVIAADDGSTDDTGAILDRLATDHPWLRVVHLTPNCGKSKALNAGILLSKGEFVLTIDADCLVDRGVLTRMVSHFVQSPRVGAVTGNPRVRNRTSLLAKIQVGEYSSIIGMIKRTQRIFGRVLTVSGVLAAYRKSALLTCGLFDSDTVTEDIDITWKLQRNLWDVRYEARALGWVLVPETLRGLWRQRVRWAQGGIEVLWKHRDIWGKVRHRRMVPIYLEYVGSLIWAHLFLLLSVAWGIRSLLALACPWCTGLLQRFTQAGMVNPLYPRWYGALLGAACLLAFLVSFLIDARYERGYLRYYFYVIWYPIAYWIISALAAIKGTANVLFGRKEITARWLSPDRGLHTLPLSPPRNESRP